jgi:cell division protein FtsN
MASAFSLPHLTRRRTARPLVVEGDDEAESGRDEAVSRFAVQLGPYRTRGQAAATRARLARRGYTAILSGRILRLGSFSSPGHAERFATRLRLVGYRPAVVAVD